jgi:hypothetical protein
MDEQELANSALTKAKNEIEKLDQLLDSHSNDSLEGKSGINLIVYGTPGCGKSYWVENTLLAGVSNAFKIRTTFYSDYSHSDFVGQILPCMKDENGTKMIEYDFVPGPFTEALRIALMPANANKMVYLVIEELNRGDAAKIFGEIFQLLDRDDNGESRYPVNSPLIYDYLTTKCKLILKGNKVYLPNNLSIIATMNTSDQAVTSLDTAFKRRWSMLKLPTAMEKNNPYGDLFVPGTGILWRCFQNEVNERIEMIQKDSAISEDRQIGAYFLTAKELAETKDCEDSEKIRGFAYKIIEYLWDDVCQLDNKEKIFNPAIGCLDDAISIFVTGPDRLGIFSSEFRSKLELNAVPADPNLKV